MGAQAAHTPGSSVSVGRVEKRDFEKLNTSLERAGHTSAHVSGYYDLQNDCFHNRVGELAQLKDAHELLAPFMNIAKGWLFTAKTVNIDYRRIILDPANRLARAQGPFWHVDYNGDPHRSVIASDNHPTLVFEEYASDDSEPWRDPFFTPDHVVRRAVEDGLGVIRCPEPLEVVGLDHTVLHAQQQNLTNEPIRRSFLRLITRVNR